jgi:hypothetical protein
MRRSIGLTAVFLALVACRGGRSPEPQPPPEWLVRYLEQLDTGLRGVDVSNGIDANEAKAIAGVYLIQYLTGCGAPDQARLEDHTWVVSLRLGVAGRKSERTIEVDARTGGVRGDGGPRYRDFASFHYTVLAEVARRGH